MKNALNKSTDRLLLRKSGISWGLSLVVFFVSQVAYGQSSSKPEFQYQSGEIRVSIPSNEEPRVTSFGPSSLSAAAKYLEDGALSWVREKSCVNCHTTGPYMVERTAWSRQFGPPSAEVHADFVRSLPQEIKPLKQADKDGHKFYPGTFTSVWRALGLSEWDHNVTNSISAPTQTALRDMFEHQSENGAFVSHGEVEIPHITTDFQLSLQAARAISVAPNWLSDLQDETLINRVAKLKTWLQDSEPKNDFDRVLKLQLAFYMPELVPQDVRDSALALLTSKQHDDGGWSTRDMSAVEDWHFEMSPYVLNLIKDLPDAAKPESDAYMTALAIVLMRQNDIPATDPRIARGLAWLKREQRESGRWWMHSLYRGNYHYITYIATVEALKAFDLCGELTEPNPDTNNTSKWNFTPDPNLPNVLILGDSISIGYTLEVREILKGKANVYRPMRGQKVVNCSGTTFGVANLDSWLSDQDWSVIHFNWGLHDLKHVESPGSNQKSNDPNSPTQATVEDYARNLSSIVAKLKGTKARLIFATTTPVAPGTRNPLREPEAPGRYNAAALEIMQANSIRVNDLFSHCEPHLGEWQLPKNVHFKAVGYSALAKQVAAMVTEELANCLSLRR